MSADESTRTVLYALAVNVTVCAVKTTAGLLSGSSAMLAEAAHSAVDCTTQVMLYAGARHERRRAGVRYVWALGAALVMLVSGGLYGLWEGITALTGPERAPDTAAALGLAVLLAASSLEATSCYRAVRTLAASRDGRGWFEHLRTTPDTASKTVVVEDGADILGNALAAAGITLTLVSGSHVFDAAASILIGLLLVALSTELGTHNVRMLRAAV